MPIKRDMSRFTCISVKHQSGVLPAIELRYTNREPFRRTFFECDNSMSSSLIMDPRFTSITLLKLFASILPNVLSRVIPALCTIMSRWGSSKTLPIALYNFRGASESVTSRDKYWLPISSCHIYKKKMSMNQV